ncbi:MAG: class I SAM-dependent methyltransferase [Cyanobacteria bacterium P01_D01_bin.115]
MLLKTTLPLFAPWSIAPSIDTLRSRYDASAHHWHDHLARLGQHQDYQRLFAHPAVHPYLHHLDQSAQILDCGVGTGAFSLALLDQIEPPAHLVGMDISALMLAQAQQHLQHRCRSLDLRWGAIRHLPFADGTFDAVIFAHVLEHQDEPMETLREMVRVLKPGAPLICSVTRQGLGQLLLSLRWQNRGYAPHQLDAGLQAAGLEAVQSFDYGTGWSKWMCIAAIGVKPGYRGTHSFNPSTNN